MKKPILATTVLIGLAGVAVISTTVNAEVKENGGNEVNNETPSTKVVEPIAQPIVEPVVEKAKVDKTFKDVTKDMWSYSDIMYLTGENIIFGYGNGQFGSKDNVTRGQVAALIHRYLSTQGDVQTSTKNPYKDVKGDMYQDAILTVSELGLMGGFPDGTFKPNGVLTRAEMARVMTTTFGLDTKGTTSDFWDMSSKHWASEAVRAMYANGLTFGDADNTFNPEGKVTREQYASFLTRGIHLDREFVANPIPNKPQPQPKPEPVPVPTGDLTRASFAKQVVQSVNPNVAKSTIPFTDVKGDEKGYVAQAITLGFIKPSDYGTSFDPSKVLTNVEMAKWVSNALAAQNGTFAKALVDTKDAYLPIVESGKKTIADSDKPSVAVMIGTGLMGVKADGQFGLNDKVTTQQANTVLRNYPNVLSKKATDFANMNEIVEIALTGTNMLSVTNYKYPFDNEKFTNIRDKEMVMGNDLSKAKFHKMIFVEGRNSLYHRMFNEENNEFIETKMKDYYRVYKELTLTSLSSRLDLSSYRNNVGTFTTVNPLSARKVAEQYGHKTIGFKIEEQRAIFKPGTTTRFWGEDYIEKAVGETNVQIAADGSTLRISNR